jgi:hypothetical protein
MEQDMDWEVEAKTILKAELARAAVSRKVLVARLERLGVRDTQSAISNRISRGKFTFVFFLQCMRALGIDDVRVGPRKLRG